MSDDQHKLFCIFIYRHLLNILFSILFIILFIYNLQLTDAQHGSNNNHFKITAAKILFNLT